MLENQKISRETKRYIADRSEKLLKGDPQTQKRVQRYKRVFLDGNASFFDRQYVRHYRSFLREKNQISLCAAAKVSGIEKYKPKTGKTETPDWKRYDQIAQQEGEKAAQGNPFYVSHKVYEKQILPHLEEKKGSMAGGSYASSPEYGDLECFLRVCRETGIKPMLVLMPVNGYWYDYTGFSAKERQKYYDHIRKAAEECGAELADFSTDEYTPYFFLDKVHLGWKGWLAVDESIYNFAKKDSKQ